MKPPPLPRLAGNDRGTSLVEFVLTAPMLLVVLFSVTEFGRLLISYHKVDEGIRAATRYIARVPCAGLLDRLDEARNIALRGTLDGSGPLILPTWTDPASIVLVPAAPNCATPPPTVALQASVVLPFPYFPFVGLPASLTVQVEHVERHLGE